MNISEANAVVRLLRWYGRLDDRDVRGAPTDVEVAQDVALLCRQAGKALQMTFVPESPDRPPLWGVLHETGHQWVTDIDTVGGTKRPIPRVFTSLEEAEEDAAHMQWAWPEIEYRVVRL